MGTDFSKEDRARHHHAVQTRLGSYRFSRTLGQGSTSKVKLIEHVFTQHQVAVKILEKENERFRDPKVARTLRLMKLLRHPNVVHIYDVIDTPDRSYIVMEYVPGGELFDYALARGKFSEEEARNVMHQLIAGLEYCHFFHIAHRDIKLENLLVVDASAKPSEIRIKTTDFGLSNVMKEGDMMRTCCGSPLYVAPEVISGDLYSGAEVDMWSCGVVLYALVCGQMPFDDKNMPQLFRKIRAGDYTIPDFVSPSCRDLIQRLLTVDPLKRATIAEIKQHQWFNVNMPPILFIHPMQFEQNENNCIDEECLQRALQVLGEDDCAKARDSIRLHLPSELTIAYYMFRDSKWTITGTAATATAEAEAPSPSKQSVPPVGTLAYSSVAPVLSSDEDPISESIVLLRQSEAYSRHDWTSVVLHRRMHEYRYAGNDSCVIRALRILLQFTDGDDTTTTTTKAIRIADANLLLGDVLSGITGWPFRAIEYLTRAIGIYSKERSLCCEENQSWSILTKIIVSYFIRGCAYDICARASCRPWAQQQQRHPPNRKIYSPAQAMNDFTETIAKCNELNSILYQQQQQQQYETVAEASMPLDVSMVHVQAYLLRGRLLIEEGRFADAVQDLEAALHLLRSNRAKLEAGPMRRHYKDHYRHLLSIVVVLPTTNTPETPQQQQQQQQQSTIDVVAETETEVLTQLGLANMNLDNTEVAIRQLSASIDLLLRRRRQTTSAMEQNIEHKAKHDDSRGEAREVLMAPSSPIELGLNDRTIVVLVQLMQAYQYRCQCFAKLQDYDSAVADASSAIATANEGASMVTAALAAPVMNASILVDAPAAMDLMKRRVDGYILRSKVYLEQLSTMITATGTRTPPEGTVSGLRAKARSDLATALRIVTLEQSDAFSPDHAHVQQLEQQLNSLA